MLITREQLLFLFVLTAIKAIVGVADEKSFGRISGGNDVEPREFPWIVSIGVMFGGVRPDHICSGALITSRHVLTAAHCVYDKNWTLLRVRGGITYLWDDNAVESNVSKIITHNAFLPELPGRRDTKNDIAILLLSSDLDSNITDSISTIALPNSPPHRRPELRADVAGWANILESPAYEPTLTLKKAVVNVLYSCDCSEKSVERGQFCGLQENGNVFQIGDGSLLISGGKWHQELNGIASLGFGSTQKSDYYTNIYQYSQWITFVTRQNYSDSS